MREIKFRSWSCKRKCYEYNVGLNDGKPVRKGYQWFNTDNDVHDSSPEQFTGLLDKNGKEIYEGDIVFAVYDRWAWCAVVEWDTINPCFVLANTKKGNFPEHEYDFDKCGQMVLEVIGNIHENSDLLK